MRLIKEYCCCAIPLLNAGIYTTLTEQFIVSVTAGILTLATPPGMLPAPSCRRCKAIIMNSFSLVVGVSVPSVVPPVFAVLCFVAAGIQCFGFMGVLKARHVHEEFVLFLTFYTGINNRIPTLHHPPPIDPHNHIRLLCNFHRHICFKASQRLCELRNKFLPSRSYVCTPVSIAVLRRPAHPRIVNSATATSLTGSSTEGNLLCNIFTWVGVGTLAGLWVVLGIFHVSNRPPCPFHCILTLVKAYLFFVISGYGSSQRDDHSKYYSLYSLNSFPGPTNDPHLPPDYIGMQDMPRGGDAWDTRESMDTVGFEKPQLYNPQLYSNGPVGYHSDGTMYPAAARTMSPAPTPAYHNTYNDPYYNTVMGMDKPEPSVSHPGQ